MKTKFAYVITILAIAVIFLGAARHLPENQGRFQLVPQSQGTMFLVDTTTGRVWRYSHLTSEKTENPSYCTGLESCLYEVDRLKLTQAGWVSESLGTKK